LPELLIIVPDGGFDQKASNLYMKIFHLEGVFRRGLVLTFPLLFLAGIMPN
jgi:hypothetical protein